MPDVAVLARSVRRSYGRTLVLKSVDFELGVGRMLCLAGPNGAGKTTLLHLLATLLRPQHGALTVLGASLPDGRESVRGRMGLIAHTSFLYPQLTLRENLHFYAGMYGLGNPQTRIGALSDPLGMGAWLDKPVGTLSRGLLQRGAWMRALLHDPELLLLDEPFTGLDTATLERLQGLLKSWRQSGKTVVLTSHELARDLPLCDEVLILRDGRVETHCAVSDYS